jgi:hypothetical protein
MFSLPTSASLSFSRLVIVSRTKVKDSRRSLYIIYTTSAITLRLSINAQIQRAAIRAISILILFYYYVIVFSIVVALTSSYSSTFSSGSRVLIISSNSIVE